MADILSVSATPPRRRRKILERATGSRPPFKPCKASSLGRCEGWDLANFNRKLPFRVPSVVGCLHP